MPAGFLLPPGYTLRQLQEKNKNDKVSLWIGTYEEFVALGSTESDTLYLFTDDPSTDALNTLSVSNTSSGDYEAVYTNNYGTVTQKTVICGLYMVRVQYKSNLDAATFMMGLHHYTHCDSPVFMYTNVNGDLRYAFVRATRQDTKGSFKLAVNIVNDPDSTEKDFRIQVRRIGTQYKTE